MLRFFSFSTRQEYYTIPAIPGMALLIGGWLCPRANVAGRQPERRGQSTSAAVLLGIGVVVAVSACTASGSPSHPLPEPDLSIDLLKKHPQQYALSFGHFLDLTPQAMGVFRGPLLGVALAFLGTLANWILRRRGRAGAGNAALAAMMVVVLACVHSAFAIFSPILSSKDLAMAIQRQHRPGDVIVVIGKYENASSLNFYTGVPLRSLREPAGNMWYGSKFPDAPRVFETPASFQALWQGPQRVFLWAEEDNPGELRGLTYYELARRGGKIIFTNRPVATLSGPG